MKVRILAAIALVAFAAQNTNAQTQFTAGLSFGSNYSSLRSNLFATENGRLGFSAGLSFVVPLGNRFELNPEIAYVQKGASSEVGFLRPEQQPAMRTYNYEYKTFEGSLLLGYQPFAQVPVRLQLGAFLDANSHNLSNKADELFVGDLQNYNAAIHAEDLNDAFGGLDFGPVAGLSLGSGRFRAGFRYYLGVKNLYNYLEFMPEGNSIRTSAFRLSATYFLF